MFNTLIFPFWKKESFLHNSLEAIINNIWCSKIENSSLLQLLIIRFNWKLTVEMFQKTFFPLHVQCNETDKALLPVIISRKLRNVAHYTNFRMVCILPVLGYIKIIIWEYPIIVSAVNQPITSFDQNYIEREYDSTLFFLVIQTNFDPPSHFHQFHLFIISLSSLSLRLWEFFTFCTGSWVKHHWIPKQFIVLYASVLTSWINL